MMTTQIIVGAHFGKKKKDNGKKKPNNLKLVKKEELVK